MCSVKADTSLPKDASASLTGSTRSRSPSTIIIDFAKAIFDNLF
ncbi:MAG TPA: hypothetical protein VF222_07415 [Nitrososphaeraceae archaeon]